MSQQYNQTNNTPDYYYEQLNSSIRNSLSFEQERAVKDILHRAIKVPSRKIVSLEITFWFFKQFYMVFYLGFDRRRIRRLHNDNIRYLLQKVLSTIFTLLIWFLTLLLFFFIAYYTKSWLGIDINSSTHIQDLLK